MTRFISPAHVSKTGAAPLLGELSSRSLENMQSARAVDEVDEAAIIVAHVVAS